MTGKFSAAALACATALAASQASATAQRTFVASNGLDTNPCSLAAPCRSFTATLAKTSAGGEIVVLDSAGYGSVTIDRAVSIIAPAGLYAGLSVFASTNGLTINAGASDQVVLRGLTINGQGGDNGIAFNTGAALYVEACTIRGFTGGGMANIAFAPNSSAKLFVKDSFLRNSAAGVRITNSAGVATVTIDNTRIENNGIGITGTFNGTLALRNSIVSENAGHGVDLHTPSGQAIDGDIDLALLTGNSGNAVNILGDGINVVMSNSTAQSNATGVFVQGGSTPAAARLTNNVITRNAVGIATGANGSILTPQSNTIEGNATDGVASSNYPPK